MLYVCDYANILHSVVLFVLGITTYILRHAPGEALARAKPADEKLAVGMYVSWLALCLVPQEIECANSCTCRLCRTASSQAVQYLFRQQQLLPPIGQCVYQWESQAETPRRHA